MIAWVEIFTEGTAILSFGPKSLIVLTSGLRLMRYSGYVVMAATPLAPTLARRFLSQQSCSTGRLARLWAIAIGSGGACAKAKIYDECDRHNAGGKHQQRFHEPHVLRIAAHAQEVRDHQHRIWNDQP